MKFLIYLNIFLLFLFLTVTPTYAFDEFPTVYKNSNFNINFSTFELGTVGTFSNDSGNNAEVVLTEFSHPTSDRSMFLGTQTMSSRSLSLFDNTSIGDIATEVSGYLSIAVDPQQLSEDGTQTLRFGLNLGSFYTILNFQYNHETGECSVGGTNLTTTVIPCADFDINYYANSEDGTFTAMMAGATTEIPDAGPYSDDYRIRLLTTRSGDVQENNYYVKNWQHFTDGSAWPPSAQGGSSDFLEIDEYSISFNHSRILGVRDGTSVASTTHVLELDYFRAYNDPQPSHYFIGLNCQLPDGSAQQFSGYVPNPIPMPQGEQSLGFNIVLNSDNMSMQYDFSELGADRDCIGTITGVISDGAFYDSITQPFTFELYTDSSGLVSNIDSTDALFDSVSVPRDELGRDYYPCGINQLDGCLRNVFIWLFEPNFDNIYFTDNVDIIKTKIPFSYFFTIQDQLSNLAQTPGALPVITVEYSEIIGEITVLDTNNYTQPPWNDVFSWLRTTSIAFIYFTLILVLYRRTRNFIDSLAGSPPDTSIGSGGDYNVKF